MGIYSPLGDLGAPYDPTTPAYLAWQSAVHARGGVVTVMPAPKGAPVNFQTVPGARYPNGAGGWRYELAPAGIVAADKLRAYQNAVAIALGKAAGVGQAAAQAVLDAPKNAFAAITGLPRWLFPVVLAGGALFLVASKLGVDLKGVGRRFAHNPRRRRYRHNPPRRRLARPRSRARR